MTICILLSLNISAEMCEYISFAAKKTLLSRHQGESRHYLIKLTKTMPSQGSRLVMKSIIYEAFNLSVPKSRRAKEKQIV